MPLFKNKYSVETARLRRWDYSSDGEYFVTICTKNHEEFFGEVKNWIMGLNEIGNIAAICWQDIPLHFPFVRLGKWVVMPNHVHGVIVINNPSSVETRHGASLQGLNEPQYNRFGPLKPNSLQSIINHFKGAVKRWCNKNDFKKFSWQSRFYDRIIDSEFESERIYYYILNNPRRWEEDRNNPENIWM